MVRVQEMNSSMEAIAAIFVGNFTMVRARHASGDAMPKEFRLANGIVYDVADEWRYLCGIALSIS
jgi:hypothetical protein